MRKSKFSETQIVEILKDAESGIPVADLLRKHAISKATFFKWRSTYGGASVADVKRLRELEVENAKLKRMYADLALENAAIKDVLNRKLQRRPRSGRSLRRWCRSISVRAARLSPGEALADGVLPASDAGEPAGRGRDRRID